MVWGQQDPSQLLQTLQDVTQLPPQLLAKLATQASGGKLPLALPPVQGGQTGVNRIIQDDQNGGAFNESFGGGQPMSRILTKDEYQQDATPRQEVQSVEGVQQDIKDSQNKKGGFSNFLPLIFNFALPAIAGAALGAKNPFMGTGAGALAGLAAGGTGWLKSNERAQTNKAASALAIAKENMADEYRKARLAADMGRDVFNQDLKTKEFNQNVNQATQNYETKKQQLEIEKTKLNDLIASKNRDKEMDFIGNSLGWQQIDPNDPKQLKNFAALLAAKKPKEFIKEGTWIFTNTQPDTEKAKAIIEAYNSYRTNVGAPGQLSSTKATNTPSIPAGAIKMKDSQGTIFYKDSQGSIYDEQGNKVQ